MKLKFTYLLALFCLLLVGCESDCFVAQKALLGVIFYDEDDLSQHTFTYLTVKGVGTDSLLYDSVSTSTIYLPLKPNDDNTSFECTYSVAITDSTYEDFPFVINVSHTPQPQLISEECGCVMFQIINEFTLEGDAAADWRVEYYNTEITNVESDIHVQVYIP